MKHIRALVGVLVLVTMALAVSGSTTAVSDTVSPGETLTVTLQAQEDDMLDYTWTSSGTLSFQLRNPVGDLVDSSTGTTDWGLRTADRSGAYTFTWTNSGTGAVTIDYEADVIPFGDAGGFFDDLWRTLLIIAVVIVVVIVVIIVLVVYVVGKDKKPAQPQYGQQQMMPGPQGPAPSNCPRCGMPVDPSGSFCQKCGARYR